MSNMVTELEADNALRGNLGYIMHPAIKNKLKQERIAQYSGDTGGQYVILPMSDAMLSDSLGYKFASTTQLAQTEVFFGNWADLIIAEWGGFEMTASMETSNAFERNQIWIRAIQEVDCGVRHPESFCYASDVVLS
jgi:HK97 family phage major capsid protein